MKKRGLISYFMILGIVLLILVGLIYYIYSYQTEARYSDVEHVRQIIEFASLSCMELTGKEALDLISKQGRVYPTEFYEYEGNNVYYAYLEEPRVVTIIELEDEVSIYVKKNHLACINGTIQDIKSKGISFDSTDIDVEALITLEDVRLTLNYPVQVNMKGASFILDPVLVSIKSPLYEMNRISEEIVDSYDEYSGYLDSIYHDSVSYDVNPIISNDGSKIIISITGGDDKYNFAIRKK